VNIESIYQKILKDMELGHRALIRFNKDELLFLTEALKNNDEVQLEKILCLINQSAQADLIFETQLLLLLKKELPHKLIIFALNASRKHIISARFQKGMRLDFTFLEILKEKLFSPHPEIVEWTLRTIEECGPQGVYFLSEFDKIKPPPWKWFNQHQRAVREILELLERRWRPVEKRKS